MKKLWQYCLNMSIYAKITAILIVCLIGYGIIGLNNFNLITGLINRLTETKRNFGELQQTGRLLMEQVHLLDISAEQAAALLQADENRHIFIAEELLEVLKKEVAAMEKGSRLTIPHNGSTITVNMPSFNELALSPETVIQINQGLDEIRQGLDLLKSLSETAYDDEISVTGSAQSALASIRKGLLVIARIENGISSYSSAQLGEKIDFVVSIMKEYVFRINIIVVVVILLLTIASYIWGWFLITPVKHMMDNLRNIIFSSENGGACGNIKEIPVVGLDEIGQVAQFTNMLISKISTQCTFRRTIEADETAYDIYTRLADLFIQKLELTTFVIYENRTKKDIMEPVFVYPPEMEPELPEIQPTSRCRAKRTGALVSSIDNAKICPVFPWQDAMSHICIPMMVGGEILGVVQFMFPFVDCLEREKRMRESVREARQFLQEALPVLKAKRLAQSLKEMATKDQLTGLFNRHYLEIYLDNIVAGIKRRNACLGILMCDLDYFKKVNDEYGHDAGDAVLKKLASILKSHARDSDLVIRFGGEEFLMLLVDCEPGESMKVAERVRSAVEETVIRLPGIEIKKTLSIGVSEFPGDGAAIWEAIKYADVALYEAKSHGRNMIVRFNQEMWEDNSY